jgi:two-component system chemotaxis response regulator CheY
MTGKQLCIARNAAFSDLPDVQLPVVVSSAVWESNRPPRRVESAAAGFTHPAFVGTSAMALNPSISVLLVDDSKLMINIIRGLLQHLGITDVDDANDGASALAKMRNKRYGLVISDWNMVPMSGYELLRELRNDPALKRTPFIMVTSESKTENVIAAKKAGVDNYIVKPFNAHTLKAKIETVFAARNAPPPER